MPVKRDALDDIFSKVIREAHDYTCCACKINLRHDPGQLDCAHVHGRMHHSTRWDPHIGAVALCKSCHMHFTKHPVFWGEFCREWFGDDEYDEIKAAAWRVKKYTKADKKEMRAHYRAQLKYLERRRAQGDLGVLPIAAWD